MHALSLLYSRFKKAPKIARVSTYLALAYAGYTITLGLIAPAVIEAQAPKKIGQLLGREVQLSTVSINPFLLRARIQSFAIQEKDDQKSFSQFDQLEVELNFWHSVFTLTPTIDHITLNAPKVQVQRVSNSDNPTFNYSDILTNLQSNTAENSQAEDKASAEEEPAIPAIRVRDIQIVQGEFHFQDVVTGANLHYQNITVQLANLDSQAYTLSLPDENEKSTLTAQANQYAFSLQGAAQSSLKLNGQFQLSPLEVIGDVQIGQFPLPPYWPLVKDQIRAQLKDGQVSFNAQYHAKQTGSTFSYQTNNGRFELMNLGFNHQDTAVVKLPSLVVDGITVSGDDQTVNIADITMKGLWADAVFNDKGLDLATLFTPVTQSPPSSNNETSALTNTHQADNQTTHNEETAPGWQVQLNHFAMTKTDLNVLENVESKGVHWRVFPLSVVTGPVHSDLNQPIDYDIDLELSSNAQQQPDKARGAINIQGVVDAKNLTLAGQLAVKSLDLSQIQPYLGPYLNVQLTKGALSTTGEYKVNSPEDISFDGSAKISNFLMKDTIERKPLIQWENMAVDSMRFSSKQNQLIIKNILFTSPYAKITITEDKRTNIGDIVVSSKIDNASGESKSAAHQSEVRVANSSSKPMSVKIQQVKFEKGSAFFADNSLTPNFASGIELLEGSIKNLSSTPGTKASVDIAGKIDKYAPVTLKGEINPLIEKPYLDLALIFKSVELTSVNPYSGTYAGYYIDKGQISLDLNYELDNNQLHGNNHVVIDQLQLGKPSDSSLATSLPLSLAIAILQDRHGVIDLGVEVSGDVDSPDFSFGSVILKALVNIVTKAVTAPFSLLADLVGTDDELNQIAFEAGSYQLDDKEKDRITKLAQALVERPMLKLSVEGSVESANDSDALAEQQVQQALLMISGVEALPEPFTASRIPTSGPLSNALEALAKKQLSLDINDERAKIIQQLTEKAQGSEVTDEKINTVLHIGLYNQLVNSTNIDKNTLSHLADARAKAIKAFLIEDQQISPDRVFLLDSRTDLKTEVSGAELTINTE